MRARSKTISTETWHRAAALAVCLAASSGAAAQAADAPATVTPLFAKPLAGIAGKEGVMLTVEYAPGASSPAHRHNANTFVYVLEGAVTMQVASGEPVTLTAGETFYESPTDIHTVSRNASDAERARILVFFVKEAGAPSTVPAE